MNRCGEAVFRTLSVADESVPAFAALAGERITLGKSETGLFGTGYHLHQCVGADVAELIFGKYKMIT